MSPRSFTHAPAVRRPDPVLLGISGPSSSGKTKTALRISTGLVSVSGGPIFFVDTEEGRAAKYAPAAGRQANPPETFAFEHVLLRAPFNPLSYVAAIDHCEKAGAGAIIVDSMSHEHEGEGGRIDSADKEAQKRAERWKCSIDKVKFGAFAPNSAERNQFRSKLGRRKCHIILCFRAKETNTQIGKDIVDEGFTPIGADAFVWELDSSILLLPHAAGVPTWKSAKRGELLCLKCDDTHKGILDDGNQLTEQHGARLARASGWKSASSLPPREAATGGAGASPPPAPPPSRDDSFPGDRAAPGAQTIAYAGQEYRASDPQPLMLPKDIEDMSAGEMQAFGKVLRALIEAAPAYAKRAWYDKNTPELLRIKSKSPPLVSWVEQALPTDSAAPPAADGDARVDGSGQDARAATSSEQR